MASGVARAPRTHTPRHVEVPGEVVGIGPEEDAPQGVGHRGSRAATPERHRAAPSLPRPHLGHPSGALDWRLDTHKAH